jgi:anti-sigma factor RsiW
MTGDHISLERISSYYSGELNEFEQWEVEDHLGTCARCAALARQTGQFRAVWEEWNIESHMALREREQDALLGHVAAALAATRRAAPQWAGRLNAWLSDWRGRAERTFDRSLDQLERLCADTARSLAEVAAAVAPRPAPGPVRTRGEVTTPAIVLELGEENPCLPFSVQESRVRVTVQVSGRPWTETAPLIGLVPIEAGRPARLAPGAWDREAWRATFDEVEAGEYIAAVEPAATGK